MNILRNDLHQSNILYSFKILGITYVSIGLIRLLLKTKLKKQPILQLPQLEIFCSLSLSAFTLGRLNSKEMKEYDKLQLRQIQKQNQLERYKQSFRDYKENVQLWTNSQFWH
ncbi:unnamed protein product [Paramecium primaurelia]|uniref:Transmembrane protein n=2 Tax=Paramecium TaxID=5884 RepID=A0A8S1VE45_9CILI|nr:unnamed protein product [Paramecium primaurelia]CAD8174080.1 unnamed protein product [Paramecium pentaurelia]CAD8174082.1 unnamed protein product [Paramecium pentaurelia]